MKALIYVTMGFVCGGVIAVVATAAEVRKNATVDRTTTYRDVTVKGTLVSLDLRGLSVSVLVPHTRRSGGYILQAPIATSTTLHGWYKNTNEAGVVTDWGLYRGTDQATAYQNGYDTVIGLERQKGTFIAKSIGYVLPSPAASWIIEPANGTTGFKTGMVRAVDGASHLFVIEEQDPYQVSETSLVLFSAARGVPIFEVRTATNGGVITGITKRLPGEFSDLTVGDIVLVNYEMENGMYIATCIHRNPPFFVRNADMCTKE